MKLENFVKQYSLADIIKIEETEDLQFLALKKSRETLKKKLKINEKHKSFFIFLVVQNAIISYQIGGTGELRWKEFATKISKDFTEIIKLENNINRRKNFLKSSKYNKRLNEAKTKRLVKLDSIRHDIDNVDKIKYFSKNLQKLNDLLSRAMEQKSDAKTIVFSCKMFGYAFRIVFETTFFYPTEIQIPVDSRLTKVFENEVQRRGTKKEILEYFSNLSKKYHIPPLHLDSLIWTKYRLKIKK